MDKDFLLNGSLAVSLYEKYAKALPIIDYHNHLSLSDLEKDTRFYDIYELWIKPDPYKHRLMRMCGVPERYITGASAPKEKFTAWCRVFPRLLGTPVYQWALMELQTVFGITDTPCEENAERLYDTLNRFLAQNEVTPSKLMKLFNVELICPCASLTDDISGFKSADTAAPSLRGDDIAAPTAEFAEKLSALTGVAISSLEDYLSAVKIKLEEFKKVGLKYTDHALDNGFEFFPDDGQNAQRFTDILNGTSDSAARQRLMSYLLVFLAAQYSEFGFTMQLHIGAQRSTSTRLKTLAGKAGGFAGIGNSVDVACLTNFLDTVEQTEQGLPKTVLFTLNPADNASVSVLSGSYSKDGVAGLITQGPAWWWCDHKQGITEMLNNTAVYGLLFNFVGMTTDSRSFLSFVRHDYFRRVLCSWIAEKVSNGDLPNDESILKSLIIKMCYENAKETVKE